jgi:hypothetical protein
MLLFEHWPMSEWFGTAGSSSLLLKMTSLPSSFAHLNDLISRSLVAWSAETEALPLVGPEQLLFLHELTVQQTL